MANDKYIKENFKPDKLWACPSFTGSSFPGITPPAEGGKKVYQHIITVGNTGIDLISFSYKSTAYNKADLTKDLFYIVSGYYRDKAIPLGPVWLYTVSDNPATVVSRVPFAQITNGKITRAEENIYMSFNDYIDKVMPLHE